MTTPDFIIALFYAVDQEMLEVPKHPEAKLSPSEVVTLALLFASKGGGARAFYRWLIRAYRPLFPQVPERTRLARLFKPHTAWPARFLAAPTVLGVAGLPPPRRLVDPAAPLHPAAIRGLMLRPRSCVVRPAPTPGTA
jgi:hypothetical protein